MSAEAGSGRRGAGSLEEDASAFFGEMTAATSPRAHVLQHPLRTLAMVPVLWRLPLVVAELSRVGEGPAIYSPLHRSLFSRITMARTTAVLALPEQVADYSAGASKQTLRRKSRAALKAGVHWARVDDPAARRELIRIADAAERENVREAYRLAQPVLDDLDQYRLWLVAYDAAERPILLSVTPTDGEWAVLRYFRTLTSSDEASLARYYMTEVLAGELIRRGVRYLVDSVSPLRITPGLRHYQRMVGFRLMRVKPHLR